MEKFTSHLFLTFLLFFAFFFLLNMNNEGKVSAELDFSIELDVPEKVMKSELFMVNITIHHRGEKVENVNFTLYCNHPERGGEPLFFSKESFEEGSDERRIYEEIKIDDFTGYRDLYAIVDPDDDFNEDNESNNMVFKTIEVVESYQDVLLIINNNSKISKEIGHYFAEKRNIRHILYLDTSEKEVITRQEFNETIRDPLKDYLVNNNLTKKINYFVTTKGVPLKITEVDSSDDNITNPNSYDRASVDSEISLLLGPYEDEIGNNGWLSNPYYQENHAFSSQKYGIYLTTRLTGYTVEDVKALIQRSVNASFKELENGWAILDVDPGKDHDDYKVGNDWLRNAADYLKSHGFKNVMLDENNTFLCYQQNVSMYASWGSNDGHDVYPHGENTGMEDDEDDDGVPDHWLFKEGNGMMNRTNEDTHGGSWSVRILRNHSIDSSALLQNFTPEKGKRYYLSGYANLSAVSGSGGVKLQLRYYDSSNHLFKYVNATTRRGTSSSWLSLPQCILEPEEGISLVQFGVVFEDATGTVYLDDIKLIEIVPNNSYLDGAIAETFVSTSARSFKYTTQYGQSLIADMIRAGVTGVKGYVYEPYLSAIAHPDILFPRYYNGFNLAESYYSASNYMSWMDTVVGDPKLAPFKTYNLDLTVVGLHSTSSKIVVGKTFTLTTEVKNVEKLPATNITLTLFEGEPEEGRVIKSFFIPRLAPGENISFTASWQINETGKYEIYSVVDYLNKLNESKENNNKRKLSLRIVEPAELRGWFISPAKAGEVVQFGKDISINFELENGGGKEAEDVSVLLILFSRESDSTEFILFNKTISVLESGESRNFGVHWLANISGNLSLRLLIDVENVVEESNETNNSVVCPVWVNLPPVAVISVADAVGEKGKLAFFYGNLSSDPDGRIAAYRWEIDGEEHFQLEGKNITVLFTKGGNYTINLSVTDNSSATVSVEISYFVNTPPRAVFNIYYLNQSKGFYIYENLIFDATLSEDWDGIIVEYIWDFGDGNTSSGRGTSHFYTKAGVYNVTLRVRDNLNASDVTTKKIKVLERTPKVKAIEIENGFSFFSQEEVIFNLSFAENNLFPAVYYFWDFGDGTTLSGEGLKKVNHSYTRPGMYEVRAKCMESYGSSAEANVFVEILNRAPEIEELKIKNEPVFASLDFEVLFETLDRDGEIVSIYINITKASGEKVFTNTLSAEVRNITCRIEEPAFYQLSLTVIDDFGERTEEKKSFEVFNSMPTPVLLFIGWKGGVDRDGMKYMLCQFSGLSSHFENGNITYYRFDFGDGNETEWSEDGNISHTYYREGVFSVTLWVKNNLGFVNSTSLSVEIVFPAIEENGGEEESTFLGVGEASLFFIAVLIVLAGLRKRK